MQTPYLFVYSSLLSGFKMPAYEYMSRYFALVGAATVVGTMYDMGEYPVANATDSGNVIKGELYVIKNEAELSFALAQLDDYEGLHPEEGETISQERAIARVTCGNEVVHAWIYWHVGDVSGKPVVASGDIKQYFRR